MTYVEFYDRTSVENVCAILTNVPERVVIVGEEQERIIKHIQHYKKVFSKRGHNIEFVDMVVNEWKIEEVVKVLTKILDAYGDCVFGCTGGDEVALVALGVLYERYRGKNVQIHRIGINDNRIYDCDNDGNTIERNAPKLSVEENIRIYGGDIFYGDITEEKTYLWNHTSEFYEDVNKIWSICRKNVGAWNIQSRVFETIENLGVVSENGLKTTTSKTAIDKFYAKMKAQYVINQIIISKLLEKGLLTEFKDTDREVVIKYKNPQVKKILTKAGLALEMKIYVIAKQVKNAEKNKVYNDVLNGVVIDWDGDFPMSESGNWDTTNEIDVLLMHGMIPVFVSCKNGAVTVEELYKLNTVAEQFGGIYSKKILVATSLNRLGNGRQTFEQRAKDMGIAILSDIQDMPDHVLADEVRRFWEI